MSDQLTAVHTAAKAAFTSRSAMLTAGSAAAVYTPPVCMTEDGLAELLKALSDRMQGVLPNLDATETQKAYEECSLALTLARDHQLSDGDRLQRLAIHGDY